MGKANRSAAGKKKPSAGKKNASLTARLKANSKAALVESAINSVQEKLENSEVRATVGDFVRLLRLQKEIDADEPKDVEVTWVEPDETKSSGE